MFEDSTFESNGRIRTRSRRWLLATFALNAGILLMLVMIPLFYPQVQPHMGLSVVLAAPETPLEQKPLPKVEATVFHGQREFDGAQLFAPSKIPDKIRMIDSRETLPADIVGNIGTVPGNSADNPAAAFIGTRIQPTVRPEPERKVRVSGMIAAGLLLYKKLPVYPELARAMRQEGTVVLAATISKQGTIENLHVMSGPAVLQQAALDAVQAWRYRPYLLNGDPVEVETTINVIFTLGR
jgi:protein TonB